MADRQACGEKQAAESSRKKMTLPPTRLGRSVKSRRSRIKVLTHKRRVCDTSARRKSGRPKAVSRVARPTIAGMMSLGASTSGGTFPFWRGPLEAMRDLCDVVVVRWDARTGDPAVRDLIPAICGNKLHALIIGQARWNGCFWRESMLRAVDQTRPTLVLTPDQDEEFAPEVREDLARLLRSDRQALMFRYKMITSDGAKVEINPTRPHMKAFKWRTGLSYMPYRGYARVHNYASKHDHLLAKSRIRHYCYCTPELREAYRLKFKRGRWRR